MSIYEEPLFLIYCCTVMAVFGAVMGSFLNCAAWRIANRESFLRGKSHCTNCGHALGVLDLIPIVSWLSLKGKCRYCCTRISPRYPLTEAFMAIMGVLCLLQFDLTVVCLRNFLFGCILFCLSLVDMEIYEIPDRCHTLAILLWLAALPFQPEPLSVIKDGLLGGIIIAGGILILSIIMDHILGKESMGGGDIKLLFVTGLYLGLVCQLFGLILACVLGLIFAVSGKKKNELKQFPFGPAIAAATWIMLLYGHHFADWYLGLIL